MNNNFSLLGRNLYDLDDFTEEEIINILEVSKVMKEINSREYKKLPTLKGKTICTLFVENSTRTRMSFELAANRLSADVVTFEATTSSLQKGESLQDTVTTLNAMGIDLYVIRHSCAGSPQIVNKHSGKPVMNAGDGRHAHPTQALLDMYSIYEKTGTIKGMKIAIVGDIVNSRVVRSNLIGMIKWCRSNCLWTTYFSTKSFGRSVWLQSYDLKTALKDADAVMGLRMQLERQTEGLFPV